MMKAAYRAEKTDTVATSILLNRGAFDLTILLAFRAVMLKRVPTIIRQMLTAVAIVRMLGMLNPYIEGITYVTRAKATAPAFVKIAAFARLLHKRHSPRTVNVAPESPKKR